MKRLMLIAALLLAGCGRMAERPDDYRWDVAGGLALTSMTDNTPAPDDSDYKCKHCKDTGWITHGDGHKTRCPHCSDGAQYGGPIDIYRKVEDLAAWGAEMKSRADRDGYVQVRVMLPDERGRFGDSIPVPEPHPYPAPPDIDPMQQPPLAFAQPHARVLLYFTGKHCSACQRYKPVVNQLHKQGHKVFTVEYDSRPDLVERFGVYVLPTAIRLNYGVESWRAEGSDVDGESLRKAMAGAPVAKEPEAPAPVTQAPVRRVLPGCRTCR